MEKNSEILKQLKDINKKLDILINLAKLNTPKQKPTKEEEKIFSLCDKKNTVADMVEKTGKKRSNVEFILNSLRTKSLITSQKIVDKSSKNKKTVYSKL